MKKIKQKIKKWMMVGVSGAIALAMGSVAFAQEMVLYPSTGEMIKAPQYGGKIAFTWRTENATHADNWWGSASTTVISPVLEKLGMVDWSIPRDQWAFSSWYTPIEIVKPHLAERYIMPDPTTLIFHIRKGVHWQNKAPMNGREFTTEDVVFNLHRYSGTGSGFTERSTFGNMVANVKYESITAPDKYTVLIKLKKVDFIALDMIYFESNEGGFFYSPEVIKEHGNAQDWKNLVGTGPYMLTDWLEGSSLTWRKNPDYWGYDEKFPANRLPYIDEIKNLLITDEATKLAALRSGKIVFLRDQGKDQAESLQKTNPELVVKTGTFNRSSTAYGMNVMKPPFDDVRVRKAMQLAVDTEGINQALFGGLGANTPSAIVGEEAIGFYIPFEEWPDQLKADYGYDPARAKKLLAEAGYPDGFKTVLNYRKAVDADLEYAQVAKDYWAKIGVDVEIKILESSVWQGMVTERTWEGLTWGEMGNSYSPLMYVRTHGHSTGAWNFSAAAYPDYDAIVEDAEATSDFKEMQRLVKKADMYSIENHWAIWGPKGPQWHFQQPWLGGYNAELSMGGGMIYTIFSRLWVDQELKESMGH